MNHLPVSVWKFSFKLSSWNCLTIRSTNVKSISSMLCLLQYHIHYKNIRYEVLLKSMKKNPWDLWELERTHRSQLGSLGMNTDVLATSLAVCQRRFLYILFLLHWSVIFFNLGHCSLLDINVCTAPHRNTSIICTIGPASRDVDTLKKVLRYIDVQTVAFSLYDIVYYHI